MNLLRRALKKAGIYIAVVGLTACINPTGTPKLEAETTGVNMSMQSDLIFIHGYGGSNCSWKAIDDGVRAFASPAYIELVGFGSNEPSQNFDFSVESQAKYLAAKIKNEVNENATLVAHSYGAAVLLIAMLDHGVEPKRIILVDPLAYQQDLPFFIKGQTITILSPLISKIMPPSLQVDIVLKAIFADPAKINQAIRSCYISEFDIPFHRTALGETARQLASFDATRYVERFSELSAEFHIIWGADDPIIKVDNLPILKRDLNAMTAVSIPDCGHAPHEECPSDFFRAIEQIVDPDEE